MISFLTSSIGGSYRIDGKRVPTYLLTENGLTDQLKRFWKKDSNVLVISASPEETDRNDCIQSTLREAFPMSGLSVHAFDMCDCRNTALAQRLQEYDAILLTGGHVPTQNSFFNELRLKQALELFDGLVIGWSAGSMNCAETVYALPELDGEALDPNYQRFIPGLGITKRMMIPHFQDVREDILDGMGVIEDMAFPDSIGRAFIALNDGSFILSENGVETLYGEAYLIKDGTISKICEQGESLPLKE